MEFTNHSFTEDEIKNINLYRDKQGNGRLKVRFIALLLFARGYELKEIADIVGYSSRSIERWIYHYYTKGIDSLNSFNYQSKKPFLDEAQLRQLVDWVKSTYPPNLKSIVRYVQEEFQVTYSVSGIRKLLKKNGLKRMRPEIRPNASTVDEQKQFIEHYQEVRSFPDVVTLFVDGMHLVHQPRASFCWGDPKHPPFILANSGRQRLNIIGAFDIECHELIHCTDEENCDSNKVIRFFEQIERTITRAHTVVLVLDNAPYFKSKAVQEWLNRHPKLVCMFLPVYSPNLNLIERLWRLAKKYLVNNLYYEAYKTFRCKVFRFLNNLSDYKDELLTLMTENFQIINKNHA